MRSACRSKPTRPSLLADTYVWLLIASVGALFLIACANVSNLFLARASARRREVATCLALGAPRRRVVQRFMTESVVLGLVGGAAGLLIAAPTSAVMLAWSTAGVQEFPDAVDLRVTGTLVVFVLGLSMLSGILLGLGPALRISRLGMAASLKEGAGGRSAQDPASARWWWSSSSPFRSCSSAGAACCSRHCASTGR